MPKQKTHSGLKRIKITGTGKLRRSHAYRGHLSASKSQNKLDIQKETSVHKLMRNVLKHLFLI